MTATATRVRSEPPPARTVALVLAHAHLRLGALALARVELETMATLGTLDEQGLVDLAEVRWRTGDINRAGEAAVAALRAGIDDPVALVIAAEAAASVGRPGEARRFAQRAMATIGGSIDAIFAGMPRSGVWPPDADEPPPSAPTLFDRGPEIVPPATEPEPRDVAPATTGATATTPASPIALGFWDEADVADPGPTGLPDPAAELDAGRAALVTGALDDAALHFGLALRLAPALAPAVLEATSGARGPSVAMVRGDAYRIAGQEDEARNAYADAARGGPPERRKRVRAAPSTLESAVAGAETLDGGDGEPAAPADDAEPAEDAAPSDGADGLDDAGDQGTIVVAAVAVDPPTDDPVSVPDTDPGDHSAEDGHEAAVPDPDGDPIA